MTTFSGVAHVAIVVRDMQRSVGWYQRVLGFEPASEVLEGPPEARHPRMLMRHPGSGLVVGLHEPLDRTGDRFDPARTGLDHFSLAVPDEQALTQWSARLHDLDVEHSPVRDAGYARFISVFDPDGIAWELWAAGPR